MKVLKESKDLKVKENGLSLKFGQADKNGFAFEEIHADKMVVLSEDQIPESIWKESHCKASVKRAKRFVVSIKGAHKILQRDFPLLVMELQEARNQFSNRGTIGGYTFEKYLIEIGIAKSTAYRWLSMANKTPEEIVADKETRAKEKSEDTNITIGEDNPLLKLVLKNSHMTDQAFIAYLGQTDFQKKYDALVEEYHQTFSSVAETEAT